MEKRIQVNIPYRMLLEKLELVIEKRLNPEIYFNGEALDTYRYQDLVRVRSVLRDHGLGITMHAPFMDLSPGGVDTKIKKATLERLQQMLEVAAVFNPQMVTFHPGYNKWFFDGNVDLWLENSLTTGDLAHAYLFVGAPHVGKMTLALDLAKSLNWQGDIDYRKIFFDAEKYPEIDNQERISKLIDCQPAKIFYK